VDNEVERLGLANGAGEPIKDVTTLTCIGFGKALTHNFNDEFVAH
jgi:hypothetical protein